MVAKKERSTLRAWACVGVWVCGRVWVRVGMWAGVGAGNLAKWSNSKAQNEHTVVCSRESHGLTTGGGAGPGLIFFSTHANLTLDLFLQPALT